MYTISLPLRIAVSKNKYFTLNLNQYRNTHFQVLNKAKQLFKGEVSPLLAHLPVFERVSLSYRIYPPSKRLFDLSNVGSVADKFFEDALVETGHLKDDNYTCVVGVTFLFGTVDKGNPRIEVTIKEEL